MITKYLDMLPEKHFFQHRASVPWPYLDQDQLDWERGVTTIESWLNERVGGHLTQWAWDRSDHPYYIGVGFRWDQDRMLFLLRWR